MPLDIRYNLKKDAWNHWSSVNKHASYSNPLRWMNPDWVKKVRGKSEKHVEKLMKKNAYNLERSKLIKIYIDSIEKAWSVIEKEYFKRLENITKKPFGSRKIKVYVTTVPKCPYNTKERWFMLNFFSPIPHSLRTAGHEIMHFQFHKYFWTKVEDEVGEKKTGDLKEALTELLNLEFRDLWMVKDEGYEQHKDLREFIAKQWQKKKDFNILLDKCVKYLKKRRI